MLKLSIVLALLFSVGCVEDLPYAPTVILHGDAANASTLKAAKVWEVFGFNVTLTPYGKDVLPDCDRHWYQMDQSTWGCAIRIEMVRDDNQFERFGTWGQAARDKNKIWLDTQMLWGHRSDLHAVAAHEVGHILLDVGDLALPSGTPAVMMGGNGGVLTEGDYQLACETIGICIEF